MGDRTVTNQHATGGDEPQRAAAAAEQAWRGGNGLVAAPVLYAFGLHSVWSAAVFTTRRLRAARSSQSSTRSILGIVTWCQDSRSYAIFGMHVSLRGRRREVESNTESNTTK